jgi:hypothetical protein
MEQERYYNQKDISALVVVVKVGYRVPIRWKK